MLIKRDTYLADLTARMGNGLVKVVTGIRRCGKTFLLSPNLSLLSSLLSTESRILWPSR